jgi:hypothetical protein
MAEFERSANSVFDFERQTVCSKHLISKKKIEILINFKKKKKNAKVF